MSRVLLAIAVGIAGGCRYRVQVDVKPSPAVLELPDGRQAIAPGVIDVRWAPWNRQILRASAVGHRPVVVDLRKEEVRFGRFIRRGFRSPRGRVELILVPEHGPTGTWTQDDVPGS